MKQEVYHEGRSLHAMHLNIIGRKTMTISQPRYSKEEFARRGEEIYNRDIQPQIEANNFGKFVAIDIETGAWEMDTNDYTATERLLNRVPDAQMWLVRVGHRATYRIGESRYRLEQS